MDLTAAKRSIYAAELASSKPAAYLTQCNIFYTKKNTIPKSTLRYSLIIAANFNHSLSAAQKP
jgi:hypothetical protein